MFLAGRKSSVITATAPAGWSDREWDKMRNNNNKAPPCHYILPDDSMMEDRRRNVHLFCWGVEPWSSIFIWAAAVKPGFGKVAQKCIDKQNSFTAIECCELFGSRTVLMESIAVLIIITAFRWTLEAQSAPNKPHLDVKCPCRLNEWMTVCDVFPNDALTCVWSGQGSFGRQYFLYKGSQPIHSTPFKHANRDTNTHMWCCGDLII